MRTISEIKELLSNSLGKLKKTGVDQGEVIYWETELGTLRTFLNRMGQSGVTRDAELFISAVFGKKGGQAYTTDLSNDGLLQVVQQASHHARHATPLQCYPLLPGPEGPSMTLHKKIFYDSTMGISPDEQVECLRCMTEISNRSGLDCSAKLMTGGGRLGIINTSGTIAVTEYTEVSLSLILTGEKGVSAYASGASQDYGAFKAENVVREAIQNADRQRFNPVSRLDLAANENYFDVILEPYAVAEWIEMLASIGFNGRLFEEGESFVSGKLNQKILGENITLYDDGSDPRGFIAPFDFEGVPKSKHRLIDHGVIKSVCYDSFLAEKYKKKRTGHALPPFDRSYGAVSRNLFMEGGNVTLEEMISSSDEPTLYITRFHYTNVVNPKAGMLTGMTKDGTFLVKNGKITGPVSNLRFLESVPEALCRVTHLGPPRLVHDPVGYGGLYPESTVVPPLKIKKLKFIGSSENLVAHPGQINF